MQNPSSSNLGYYLCLVNGRSLITTSRLSGFCKSSARSAENSSEFSGLIILGGGGHKPKDIRSLQEDELLTKTNAFMRKVSDDILARTREKEIWYSEDDLELLGNLEFTED